MAKEVSYEAGLMDFVAIYEMALMVNRGGIENHGFNKINANQQPHDTDDMQGSTDEKSEKKLSGMYDALRAFLPQLSPKAGRAKIVDEATNYIKSLEQTLKNLERKKLERLQDVSNSANITPLVPSQKLAINSDKPSNGNIKCSSMGNLGTNSFTSPVVFKTLTSSSNVTMHVCGSDAHINICSLKKSGLISSVCYILVKNNMEVVTANISSDDANAMIMFHVRVNVPHELAGEVPYEEIYKQVANEIMLVVNNGINE